MQLNNLKSMEDNDRDSDVSEPSILQYSGSEYIPSENEGKILFLLTLVI